MRHRCARGNDRTALIGSCATSGFWNRDRMRGSRRSKVSMEWLARTPSRLLMVQVEDIAGQIEQQSTFPEPTGNTRTGVVAAGRGLRAMLAGRNACCRWRGR